MSDARVLVRDLEVCYVPVTPLYTLPEVDVNANTAILWPPNKKEVNVTFSGTNLNISGNATYTLTDEYGEYSYSGNILNGAFSITHQLRAFRLGDVMIENTLLPLHLPTRRAQQPPQFT